ILDFLVSPDEQFVLLPITTDADSSAELLYAMRTDGTQAAFQISNPLTTSTGFVTGYSFTPDSRTVLYNAFESPGGMELYSSAVPEPSTATLALIAVALGSVCWRGRRHLA